jgi:GntR family transcriptional regulator
MIELVPDEHKWRQVMEILRQRILDGTYRPRSRVPSVRHLTQMFGIGDNTARHALKELEERGYVRQLPSVGTFVRPAEEWPRGDDDA